ncbi:exopolysaccharide biosynthesis polyprenyl glycosylphosphotransferase [Streptomyces sp. NBC_01754]|uniref:exopolysaccharide biosynthesis polyprenyl glycosylphosphotransferase n=1 Tax=Streptomyces sp. NBC_01754 TaxID=2975930 RepID=UPI002DD9F207|nr:exopolysaccharide biosynthesis polyprenyl glycosylphosphotransferase [Streptomyces sp. NBC_01754]WSC91057.1 exopolysaccharide biosynthesis polyprenyl glycosylphosphotransferase [Streptomyces sp. NBC_01754]
MTTESAPIHRTARATAVRGTATVRPPRDGGGAGELPRAARDRARWAYPAGLLAVDGLAVGVAAVLVAPASVPWPVAVLLPQVAAQVLLHAFRRLYRGGLSPSAAADLPALLGAALVQWCAAGQVLAACDPGWGIGWTALLGAVGTQLLLACCGRAAVYRLRRRAAARSPRSALVIGDGPVADRVTAVFQEHAEYGLRPVGRVGPGAASEDRDGGPAAACAAPLPVLSTARDVGRAVIQNSVRHAVFTAAPESVPEGTALFELFVRHGCRVWLVTDLSGPTARELPARDHVWGFSAAPLHHVPHHPVAYRAKRAMDAVLASVALVAAAPLMAVCALAVRVCDGPGVLFRQERVGRHGQPFVLLKFRTLRPADAHEAATRWNVARDHRMSRAGRFLRRTSLDELPQLWNVLRGDMSLVGPRPERPYFVQQFSGIHPGYRARHRMPVGITGLAQVHGLRGDTSIEDRVRFDNRYIETWSLWQDVCVLARTAGSVFRLGGS